MNTTLKTILETQTESFNTTAMAATMANLLIGSGAKIETDQLGNLFATKGTPPEGCFYPCIVAHLDSVHEIIPDDQYHVLELGGRAIAVNSQTMDFTGIGGDDKCGLYIAVQTLRLVPYCKVALFVDEEVGCDGSNGADLDWFDDVAYLIQNDRKGYVDSVRTILGTRIASDDFCTALDPLVEKYQRSWCDTGGLTDVYTLATRGLELSAINLSCGYYRPHMDDEYIDLAELEAVLQFNVDAVRLLGGTRYPNKAERTQYTSRHIYGYVQNTWAQSPETSQSHKTAAPDKCTYCHQSDTLDGDSWGYWCNSCGAYIYQSSSSDSDQLGW